MKTKLRKLSVKRDEIDRSMYHFYLPNFAVHEDGQSFLLFTIYRDYFMVLDMDHDTMNTLLNMDSGEFVPNCLTLVLKWEDSNDH